MKPLLRLALSISAAVVVFFRASPITSLLTETVVSSVTLAVTNATEMFKLEVTCGALASVITFCLAWIVFDRRDRWTIKLLGSSVVAATFALVLLGSRELFQSTLRKTFAATSTSGHPPLVFLADAFAYITSPLWVSLLAALAVFLVRRFLKTAAADS